MKTTLLRNLALAALALLAAGALPGSAAAAGTVMHVSFVATGWTYSGGSRKGDAHVDVADADGLPVLGATVTGTFSGCTSETASAVTALYFHPCCSDGTCSPGYDCVNGEGRAQINGKKGANCGIKNCCFTFTVTGVSKPGYTYDPSQNLMSRDASPCNPLNCGNPCCP
jgi:hypothetical protein